MRLPRLVLRLLLLVVAVVAIGCWAIVPIPEARFLCWIALALLAGAFWVESSGRSRRSTQIGIVGGVVQAASLAMSVMGTSLAERAAGRERAGEEGIASVLASCVRLMVGVIVGASVGMAAWVVLGVGSFLARSFARPDGARKDLPSRET